MEKDIHKTYKNQLDGKHACYILITCDLPDDTGNMNVNFSYEGDPVLVSYL